jgi:hypothetical protein
MMAAQFITERHAQVLTLTFSSDRVMILIHEAMSVRYHAAHAPGPKRPLTFAIPRGSGAEPMTLRCSGIIAEAAGDVIEDFEPLMFRYACKICSCRYVRQDDATAAPPTRAVEGCCRPNLAIRIATFGIY